jgi:hypothetical protein
MFLNQIDSNLEFHSDEKMFGSILAKGNNEPFTHALRDVQSLLGGFISENSSSMVCLAAWRARSLSPLPAMLIPCATALISSRKSERNRKGSEESLATRAIKPAINNWHAIMRPFSSSIIRLSSDRAIMAAFLVTRARPALLHRNWSLARAELAFFEGF